MYVLTEIAICPDLSAKSLDNRVFIFNTHQELALLLNNIKNTAQHNREIIEARKLDDMKLFDLPNLVSLNLVEDVPA